MTNLGHNCKHSKNDWGTGIMTQGNLLAPFVCEVVSLLIPLHNVSTLFKVNAFQYYQLCRNSYYFPLLYECLEMFSYFAFVFLVSIMLLLWFCFVLFLLFHKVIWDPLLRECIHSLCHSTYIISLFFSESWNFLLIESH